MNGKTFYIEQIVLSSDYERRLFPNADGSISKCMKSLKKGMCQYDMYIKELDLRHVTIAGGSSRNLYRFAMSSYASIIFPQEELWIGDITLCEETHTMTVKYDR